MANEKINNQSFGNGIVVDDGSIKEQIRNKFDEVIGEFIFRPGDLNIIKRFNDVEGNFEKITEPLEHIDINPDGTANKNDAVAIKVLEESEKRLYDAVNHIFDADAAAAFFGRMNPFSIIEGHFYCENVLNVLGSYISKHFGREVKRFNSNVNKYTHGYRTGKHKNGGKRKK